MMQEIQELHAIWDRHVEKKPLTEQDLNSLIWHLENDIDPAMAITITTDMGLKKLGPYIAKHLDNEDDFIREITVGCLLGQLELDEYAEIGLKMALEDTEENVRALAAFNLGAVLDKIPNKALQYKVACFLYNELNNNDENETLKPEAYQSVLTAMEVPYSEQPKVRDLGKDINLDLVNKFKEKYKIT
jgi:hypothetical protein